MALTTVVALALSLAAWVATARAQHAEEMAPERAPAIEPDRTSEEVDAFAWEFSLRGGASQASDELTSQGMAPWSAEAGMEMRLTLWRYLALAGGMQGVFGSDTASFQETACEIIDGRVTSNCYTFDSTVSGFVFRAEAGALYRYDVGKSWQAVADLSLGYRTLDMHRGLDIECSDCTHVELSAHGGLYLSPELNLIFLFPDRSLKGLGLTFGTDVFLTGDIIVAVWGGLLFKVF